jgi:hypothetical protein
MTDEKPKQTAAERNAKRREVYHAKRAVLLADEYFEHVNYGKSCILREDYGKFRRWTYAERNGDWLKEAACEKLISGGRIKLLRGEPDCQVYGTP